MIGDTTEVERTTLSVQSKCVCGRGRGGVRKNRAKAGLIGRGLKVHPTLDLRKQRYIRNESKLAARRRRHQCIRLVFRKVSRKIGGGGDDGGSAG